MVINTDTGYELPHSLELYSEVERYYKQQYPELKFYTARNHNSVLNYWDKLGVPSRIHRWCCAVMKSAPLSLLLKQINGTDKQPKTMLFDGVRAEESASRASRSRIGKNVKHNNMINVRPILEWSTVEVYLYLLLHKLPFNKAYRNGLSRVGCAICPYSSGWSEDLCGILYPDTVKPFIEKIRKGLEKNNVSGVDNYIKLGKWKVRAGGRYNESSASMSIISIAPTFKATIHASQENLFMWLRTLGTINMTQQDHRTYGSLKYRNHIYNFDIEEVNDAITIIVDNIDPTDVTFVGHLKRVLYKTTYCEHCEVCEVECPTGALSVVPRVVVDSSKCIHCFNCLEFHEKGCMVANSIDTSASNILNNQSNIMASKSRSSIDRYRDGMGMRSNWVDKYFDTYETFFDNPEHGLNPKYQLPPFINWLREALILDADGKNISEVGRCMAKAFATSPQSVWEIIFIGLCENSEICSWFNSTINFNHNYSRDDMDILLQDSYPDLKDRTLRNPFNSLLNTFKESPLGSTIPVGVLSKEKNKVFLTRHPHSDISLVAVAYSLFRYAERQGRYMLTVSEFYDENQKEGIYRQFGINKDTFERLLLSLQEESNHVLRAELNMGLDNIILREDLKSIDILKMML